MAGFATPSSRGYPWLVADIGGTNARFGLVRGEGAPVEDVRSVLAADFADPAAAARSYLDQVGAGGARIQPHRAAFALAGAMDTDPVKLTNSAWEISRTGGAKSLGVDELLLLNDFEVLALALPHLKPADLTMLGGSAALDPKQPMAVTGPGTGLGVGYCVPARDRWIAVPTEGGHVTASAADDFESEVLRLIRGDFAHVSAERVLSGIGLPLLHVAVSQVRGLAAEPLASEEITRRALDGDGACAATLDTFCSMLGSFAGNLAVTIGARGGVFIAGGIAQRLQGQLLRSRFRERFEAKGRFAGYLRGIATALITAPHAALVGAAQGIENRLAGG